MEEITLIIILIEFLVLSVVCFAVIRYYKSHMVSTDVTASVYLSWILGFVGILLLPYDISSAVVQSHQHTNLALERVWLFAYWR